MAAFGLPVVPLVKWRSASVSGGVGGISSSDDAARTTESQSSVFAGTPGPSSTTITWRSVGIKSRIAAILRAYSEAVVTSTLPLAHGVTSVVDEADFVAERWYQLLERERVTVWYTAPTAIRMLMKAGPELARRHDLSRLRVAASVGEPLNPEAVVWGLSLIHI